MIPNSLIWSGNKSLVYESDRYKEWSVGKTSWYLVLLD
jgi:hypothetical protein